MTEIQNLDAECAKAGKDIVDNNKDNEKGMDIENVINKSLGVLQEDGIYAFYTYLKSESDPNFGVVENKTSEFLKEKDLNLIEANGNDELLGSLKEQVLEDLDKTFFCKEVLEKTLIYARYHAKALSDNQESKEEE